MTSEGGTGPFLQELDREVYDNMAPLRKCKAIISDARYYPNGSCLCDMYSGFISACDLEIVIIMFIFMNI